MQRKMNRKRNEHYLVKVHKQIKVKKRESLLFSKRYRNMSDKEHNIGTTIQKRVIISIVTIFVVVFVYQAGLMVGADALTRYYNCTTRVANKNGTLSLQNIENCYDQVFKGAKQAEKDEASLRTSDSPS
jgi:hypothetical protein